MGADSQEEEDEEEEERSKEGDEEREIELRGHSEKILGQLAGHEINFSRYEETPGPQVVDNAVRQSKYPD
jgi:hypothetical protein